MCKAIPLFLLPCRYSVSHTMPPGIRIKKENELRMAKPMSKSDLISKPPRTTPTS